MKIFTKMTLIFIMISLIFGIGGIISLEKLDQMTNPIIKIIPQKIDELSLKAQFDKQAQLIRYYDEVLTQSARNYAFTQDKKWEERYQKTEPILDELIKDAINHGTEGDKRIFENINTANIALVKMEYDSLERVNNGQSDVAIQILESSEYWEQKKIYQKGIEDYVVKQNMILDDIRISSTNSVDEIIYKVTEMINFNRVIILFSIPIVLVSFLVLGFFISKSFSEPIKNIILGIDHIKKGDLEFVIKHEGSEEHREVIDAFNQMTIRIKESQLSLKQQLQQIENLQSSLDNSSITAITDSEGKILHVNKKFCDISKYSKEELIGQNHRILKSGFHPQEFYQGMWNTISKGKVWRGDIKNKAKDGSFYWVKTIIVPIIDKNDKLVEYVSIRTDITKEKILYERLVDSTEKLMKHERFTAVGEITSRLAHDLRNYLTVIQSSTDLIRMKTQLSEDTTLTKYLEQIDNARLGISYQIDGVLGFVKIRSLDIEQVSLLMIIKSAIATLTKPDKIKVTLPQNDLIISCDPKQLEIVIINLITNAIQSIDDTGQIQIRIQDDDKQVLIEVEDSGLGIPADILPRIFEPLFTTKQTGTGLGLLSCRNIVEQHRGTISVQSTIGKGTIFKISLPNA